MHGLPAFSRCWHLILKHLSKLFNVLIDLSVGNSALFLGFVQAWLPSEWCRLRLVNPWVLILVRHLPFHVRIDILVRR
jgi:hypothetical protein